MNDQARAKSYGFDELEPGMSGRSSRVVSAGDIDTFSKVSGDVNPVHLDDDYAATTIFGGRIAHGLLIASYISATIANVLPGPGWIYVTQDLRFKAPVRIGDEVETTITVVDKVEDKKFVTLETVCAVGGKPVIEGTAVMMAPRLKKT